MDKVLLFVSTGRFFFLPVVRFVSVRSTIPAIQSCVRKVAYSVLGLGRQTFSEVGL
jgi:hypothetical protein